jgi:hypothetical protein
VGDTQARLMEAEQKLKLFEQKALDAEVNPPVQKSPTHVMMEKKNG